MSSSFGTLSGSVLTLLVAGGVLSGAGPAKDLSRYRDYQLGSSLADVAKRVGISQSDAKILQRRPALIQELDWRPQPPAPSQTESVREVAFTFYNGELYRIAVDYDRYETEGMTADDFIEAISPVYGTAEKPVHPANTVQGQYGDLDEIVAQWQDSQYSFQLIRSLYGPTFRMVGVLKSLEASAQAATLEAKRLDDKEAPQREAARKADEKEASRLKLEKARLLSREKFRQ